MHHAIVVFTKVPQAGHTKTRLTIDRGGILTPEEARDFYTASLLDVVDACIASRSGDVYICQEQGGDGEYLRQLLNTTLEPQAIKGVFADAGGSFDQAMQYAADYILKQGADDRLADTVLIVGGDATGVQPATLRQAVNKLEMLAANAAGRERAQGGSAAGIGAALVTSADQEAGFNIIGYTCTTPFTIAGIFYNLEGVTALDGLVRKVAAQGIPFAMIEMVPDVDLPTDLASLVPVIQALQVAERYDATVYVPQRTRRFIEETGLQTSALPNPALSV